MKPIEPRLSEALLAVRDMQRSLSGFARVVPGGTFQQLVVLANQEAIDETTVLTTLIEQGFDRAALVHARGLLELRVHVEFIASGGLSYSEDPSQVTADSPRGRELRSEVERRSKAFLMYSAYWISRRARSLKLTDVDAVVHNVARLADDEFSYSRNRHRWWPMSLLQMAREIRQEDRYHLIYGLGSDLIHHGGQALLRHALPHYIDWQDRELAIWSATRDLEYLLWHFESEFSAGLSHKLAALKAINQDIDNLFGAVDQ